MQVFAIIGSLFLGCALALAIWWALDPPRTPGTSDTGEAGGQD